MATYVNACAKHSKLLSSTKQPMKEPENENTFAGFFFPAKIGKEYYRFTTGQPQSYGRIK